jgi:hypothetical protein
MKTRHFILCGWIMLFSMSSFAQITQTIRGTIVDQESQFPLIGVNVSITSITDHQMGASTDLDGNFRIEGVPVGRHDLIVSYLGYGEVILSDIIVSSAKEVILNIEMEEAYTKLDEVTIVAKRNGDVVNEVATVSAREFSVQETNRYAGSRGEPARMASNFAGVQGADDSRNDIVVRGNTPSGVLWRLEGVNIPNPNHFAVPGTGGGSVTILNNKFLANSDFFTGAFPAEYANGISGVFDLKMRNGNNEKHEFSAQLGLLGLELAAEGPLSKNSKASYLAMYRYSTLSAFQFLNIDVGTDAIPNYQDAAFRLNFPLKGGANFALFGIGGDSHIDIILHDKIIYADPELNEDEDLYGASSRDQYFGSTTGVIGMNYTKPVNTSMYFKATLSASHYHVFGKHDLVERQWGNFDEDGNEIFKYVALHPILDYAYDENKYSAYVFMNKKFSRKFSMKAGINYDLNQVNYIDSAKSFLEGMSYADGIIKLGDWRVRWDARDFYSMVQPYAQFKYKATEKFTLTGGATMLYSDINENTFSPFEPRLGMTYQIDDKQKISFGSGLHSQLLYPYSMYYSNITVDRDPQEYNLDLGFTKSLHAVLAYDRLLGSNMRMKAEVYYQYLYDIPVSADKIDSYSIVNEGSGYGFLHPDPLKNAGLGRNYGLELTLEKFFSKGYYFLVTGSLFDAKFAGTDDVWRNTTYNGRFAANALFAKEWNINAKSTINFGGKFTTVGGRWYGDIDYPCSERYLEPCYISETVNTKQARPYYRLDAKLNYRFNAKRVTHEIAIDIVNVLGTKNVLTPTYEPGKNGQGTVVDQYQLGFFPIFYYKLDF